MLLTHKETIKRSTGRYFRFVEAALSAVKAPPLPLYSCKYSKKEYTEYGVHRNLPKGKESRFELIWLPCLVSHPLADH
jgi:hypothetical protein